MTAPKKQTHTETALLDVATKLAQTSRAIWRPTVGEHTIVRHREPPTREYDPDRVPDQVRSSAEARRRAQTTMRRFAVHSRLDRLITLTIAAETSLEDRAQVVRWVQRFFSGLRKSKPALRYMYSLELHPGGHGYHVHAGVSEWLSVELIRSCWPHGFIDVRRIKTKARGDSKNHSRLVARYLAKYACKSEDEGRQAGRHRYERSQTGGPTEQRLDEAPWWACEEWLRARIRGRIQWETHSDSWDDWRGPVCLLLWE